MTSARWDDPDIRHSSSDNLLLKSSFELFRTTQVVRSAHRVALYLLYGRPSPRDRLSYKQP